MIHVYNLSSYMICLGNELRKRFLSEPLIVFEFYWSFNKSDNNHCSSHDLLTCIDQHLHLLVTWVFHFVLNRCNIYIYVMVILNWKQARLVMCLVLDFCTNTLADCLVQIKYSNKCINFKSSTQTRVLISNQVLKQVY